MTRSRLKNKANKSGKQEDLKAYKKQRNLVLKLNRKAKKNFRKLCKPFFTEKGSQYDQDITLIEKKRSIPEKQSCKYFQQIFC